MLESTSNESLGLLWRLHALSESSGMTKVMNGRQGLFFAILLSKFHVGLVDRKFALERAWYAFWSSFFPHSMKMFRLSLFPFSGSHIVILGIACLCRDGTCAFNAVLVFLYHLCTLYGSQSDFLRSCTTGNILHPDSPREMVNVYWRFKEFPPWYKSRKLGWYAYGFLPSSVVDKACGGLSSICGRVVAGFFGGQTSLTRGIMLPGRDGNVAVNAVLGFFVMDEKAHKLTWSVKGASGAKCC